MKIYIEVYGCTANKGDASLIKGILKQNNYELTSKIDHADCIVILTCTVIDTTEQRMLSRIKMLKKTAKRIIVAGCMASAQKEKVKSVIDNVEFLPPQYSHHIVDLLEKKDFSFVEKNKTSFPKFYDDIAAPISIAEGCMFSCSYCITTLARGRLRSFLKNEIKKDVVNAVRIGCKEIQLTAQDTSSYGLDTNSDLGELLKDVCTIEGNFRIRVGMMNPFTCLKNIDSIIIGFDDSKIYKFLHLPVQSGDNLILEKMNRKYSVDDFLRIIRTFRDNYPDITISTDVIVGFPSETDEQFKKTVDLLNIVKPDITNITRFSARPFTKAKTMKGRVKTEIVKKRSKVLTELCSKISEENNQKNIGRKYNIIVTERGKNKTMIGRTGNYKPVVLKEKIDAGSFVNVEITGSAPNYLFGSII